jgi:hypothetical protein
MKSATMSYQSSFYISYRFLKKQVSREKGGGREEERGREGGMKAWR